MIRFGPEGSELVYGSVRGHVDIDVETATWSDVLSLELPGLGYHKKRLIELHRRPEKRTVTLYVKTGDYAFLYKSILDNLFQPDANLSDVLNLLDPQ